MKIIALVNQKGGTGKTTSAVNIGAGLAKLKRKVMLIDLDPQAHLTYSLGIQADDLKKTVYNVLKEETGLKEVVMKKAGMDVIPSSIELSGAEVYLNGQPGGEVLLKESLTKIKEYDYILLDCPPSLGILTINGLAAANEIYIPLQTEFLAFQGLTSLTDTINIVKKRLNNGLEITGIIGTRFDMRKVLNRQVIEKAHEHFGSKIVFKILIRENITLAEAPSHGKTIFEYDETSHGAEDYLNLCKEILEREGGK